MILNVYSADRSVSTILSCAHTKKDWHIPGTGVVIRIKLASFAVHSNGLTCGTEDWDEEKEKNCSHSLPCLDKKNPGSERKLTIWLSQWGNAANV
jgi:hypothetical protein